MIQSFFCCLLYIVCAVLLTTAMNNEHLTGTMNISPACSTWRTSCSGLTKWRCHFCNCIKRSWVMGQHVKNTMNISPACSTWRTSCSPACASSWHQGWVGTPSQSLSPKWTDLVILPRHWLTCPSSRTTHTQTCQCQSISVHGWSDHSSAQHDRNIPAQGHALTCVWQVDFQWVKCRPNKRWWKQDAVQQLSIDIVKVIWVVILMQAHWCPWLMQV